jgi:Ras-related protein Rab-8A
MSTYNIKTHPRKKADYDYLIKIGVIGNSAVGKSCVILRYIDDKFAPSFLTTIGIDFKIKMLTSGSKRIKLQVWDTAGQDRFRSITHQYLRGLNVIILIYDVNDIRSFESVTDWVLSINEKADEYVQVILVGNKIDIGKRQITYEMGVEIARKYKMSFFECSAKTNTGIDEIFKIAIELTLKTYEQHIIKSNKSSVIQLKHPKSNNNENENKCKC